MADQLVAIFAKQAKSSRLKRLRQQSKQKRKFSLRRADARWLSSLGVAVLLIAGAASAADVQVMTRPALRVYASWARLSSAPSGHRLLTTRGPSMGDSPEAIPARLARGETAVS